MFGYRLRVTAVFGWQKLKTVFVNFVVRVWFMEGNVVALDMVDLLIQIVVNIIVIAPSLWLAGRALVGEREAKFVDAIWIVVLGTAISAVVNELASSSLLASIILLVILLGLVKHFFDCGWLKAFAIAVFAVIIFIVIMAILALIGIGIGLTLWLL